MNDEESIGYAHEGRLKGEKEDGIKRGKKGGSREPVRGRERGRREKYEEEEREIS